MQYFVDLVPSSCYHGYLQTKLRLSKAQQSLALIADKHNFPLSAIGQYKKDIQMVDVFAISEN